MNTPSAVLRLRNITHTFPDGTDSKVALDSVNLDVRIGELVAIMGPSGSGKTTLLNIAAGIVRPDTGQVIVNNRTLSMTSTEERSRLRREEIGIVFQQNSLVSALSVLENVALPLELNGVKAKSAQAQAEQYLTTHGLNYLSPRDPASLSGGERQQIAVVAALAGQRSLLLADEPTGALDSRTADQVMRFIRNKVEQGAAGLLVTHDARQAAWADRILFLKDGVLTGETGPSLTQSLNPVQVTKDFPELR
ncbi:ABC transporter ATP-binding protein [Jonesiaceae bacterium BS-20]|uniref:ABC transporter ATP-binding protein n=1 Tax=Jonesiaceae bacterium BS-20 TaxID=3120821 RepID=A0AAU7DU26_9MICO